MPWFSVFVDQKHLKIIWKFSLSQYRCQITPIDVENCVKSALNSNNIKQNFTVITIWGGGDYQLRSALAAKQIWLAVITIWGTLDSLPHRRHRRPKAYWGGDNSVYPLDIPPTSSGQIYIELTFLSMSDQLIIWPMIISQIFFHRPYIIYVRIRVYLKSTGFKMFEPELRKVLFN